MFNTFEYLSTIYQAAGLAKIYKASGISNVEDLLSDLTNAHENCVIVRDSGDGFLNLRDRRLDTAYHIFYVFSKGKFNDHSANLTAKRAAMALAIALLDRMKSDAFDYGDPAYGFEASRVDYAEIGPIGQSFYGYSFSFTMEHEF